MIDFNIAVDFVLKNEGGFVNNENDAGGATNFGISLRFLRQLSIPKLRQYGLFRDPANLGVTDVESLTVDQAKNIYQKEFWEEAPYEKLESQFIVNYLFDMSVLHGTSQAIKILQRATWATRSITALSLQDDGFLGEYTILAVNNIAVAPLLIALQAERAGYCRLLAAINPKDKENLHGWLNRCYRIEG